MTRLAVGARPAASLALALALHALVLILAFAQRSAADPTNPAVRERPVTLRVVRLPEPQPQTQHQPQPAPRKSKAPVLPPAPMPLPVPEVPPAMDRPTVREPASAAAPPAPTAAQWAFASTYKLKNSKGYRYTWGQQVRSMMGTVVEGPDQGMVRFRVEIAPDGNLVRLQTLWSTSAVAEQKARHAISSMPRWPSTPTGQSLIFEKTISFSPFATNGPPLYQDDCKPDAPEFNNPFAWDGISQRAAPPARAPDKPDPQAMEDCLRQLPKDSVEAESARDQRLMERWGWSAGKPAR